MPPRIDLPNDMTADETEASLDAMSFAGAFRDDPTLREIAEETYRLRDEQKAAEFPD